MTDHASISANTVDTKPGLDTCPCGACSVCNCYLRYRAIEDDADREMGNHFEHNVYFSKRRIGDK